MGLGAGCRSLKGFCLKPSVQPLYYISAETEVQTGDVTYPKTLPDKERSIPARKHSRTRARSLRCPSSLLFLSDILAGEASAH